MTTLVHAALSYAAIGWPVIPLHSVVNGVCTCGQGDCRSPAKHPHTRSGLKDGSTKPNDIKNWWQKWPRANIGILTGGGSGIVVIDIDPRHDGPKSLDALLCAHSDPSPTVEAITGGGGRHLVFAHPGGTLGNRIALLPGIDVRGDGGYVVGPPSLHMSGSCYRWCAGQGPGDIKPAVLWAPLLDLLRGDQAPQTRQNARAVSRADGVACLIQAGQLYTARCTPVAEGERNNAAFRIAGHLCAMVTETGAHLLMENILNLLRPWNDQNTPPLAENELAQAVRSAMKNGTPRTPKIVPVRPDAKSVRVPRSFDSYSCDAGGSAMESSWPSPPGDDAFSGLAGEVVRTIEPHSEADPVALLTQFLVAFGNVIGRSAYFQVEGDEHYVNLFATLVGRTAAGRKGTSWGRVSALLRSVDAAWSEGRIMSGLSSGEGLIWQVRDPLAKREVIRNGGRKTGRVTGYQDVEFDGGESDKRMLVVEPEFASALRVASREGNTLSPTIRQAWDGGSLRVLTKNSPARATRAHISIIAHVTRDELRRYLRATEMANGFANRFLWVCVRRSKALPEGGKLTVQAAEKLTEKIMTAVQYARKAAKMHRDDSARKLWADAYPALSEGRTGLLGAALSRAEAQVLRLSCVYALLDRSVQIRSEHLRAALALWDYVERSAKYIFGTALGDPLADEILRRLLATPGGMSRTQIRDVFSRHRAAGEIDCALSILLEEGHAESRKVGTGGRSTEMWCATSTVAASATESLMA